MLICAPNAGGAKAPPPIGAAQVMPAETDALGVTGALTLSADADREAALGVAGGNSRPKSPS